MGKPDVARYTSNDGVSLHTTPDDYNYDDLPTYADSEAAVGASSSARPILNGPTFISHNSPQDDYERVSVKEPGWATHFGGKTSNQAETTARIDERLTDPYNLYAYVMDCVRMIPPTPMVRILGFHYESKDRNDDGKESKQRVLDFDLSLSLQHMLRQPLERSWWHDRVVHNNDQAYRGSYRKTRAPGNTQGVQLSDEPIPGLQEWCEQYCASPSRLKVFRVTRKVGGLDYELLASLVTDLVRSTEYRGQLEVTFPVNDKYVDIYSPHIVNRWRTSWVRYIFYFTMLWIITWPLLFLMTKWYAVYTVTWNFSLPAEGANSARRFACLSERQWVDYQKNYIKHLIFNGFSGVVDINPQTIDDYANRPEPTRATSNNEHIDSTLNHARRSASLRYQSRGRLTASGWGYDQ